MRDELSLILRVEAEPNADPEALAEMGGRLRAELLEIDVRSARPLTAGDAPPGTRAAELAVLGGLLVSLAKSPETLKAVVGAVQGWLSGQRARSVEIEVDGDVLKVNGISSAEQQRLIDLFVERHAR